MDNPDFPEQQEEEGMDADPSQEQEQDASEEPDGEHFDIDLEAALDAAMGGLGFPEGDQQEGQQQEEQRWQGPEASPQQQQQQQQQQQGRPLKRPLSAMSDDMPSVSRPQSQAGLVEELQQADAARKRAVFEAMTEDQRNRYEAYCRAAVPRKKVKKLVQALQGNNAVNDKVLIAISSITKMFLGEIVEKARILASQQQHEGALLPSHIRQAYAELHQERKVPHRGPARPLLR